MSSPSASQQAMVDHVRQAYFFPFDCGALVAAHEECTKRTHWSNCEAAREAMDQCVEAGERRRFSLLAECNRLRRLHQSCLLHGGSDCMEALERLHDCVRQCERAAKQKAKSSSSSSSAVTSMPRKNRDRGEAQAV